MRTNKTRRFAIESLERRDTPSSVATVPAIVRSFDPQPDPPAALVNPVSIRTFVIEGGRTFVIEGGRTANGG